MFGVKLGERLGERTCWRLSTDFVIGNMLQKISLNYTLSKSKYALRML